MTHTSTVKPSPFSPEWRPRGITVSSMVSFDVRESNAYAVWEHDPDASNSRRSARAVINAWEVPHNEGPIYVHGESLEQIADWFEQAAADIRARKDIRS